MAQSDVERQYLVLKRQGLLAGNSNNDDLLRDALDDGPRRSTKSKENMTTRAGYQLPNIKERVGSSGQPGRQQVNMSVTIGGGETPKSVDPFRRVNKFKNVGIAKQSRIAKPRYSHQELSLFASSISGNARALSGGPDHQNEDPRDIMDIVNRGKQALAKEQLKPLSTKNLNTKLVASAAFEINQSIGLFRTANQDAASQEATNRHMRSSEGATILPKGVQRKADDTNKSQLISINNKASQKSRKISITSIAVGQPKRDTHSQSVVEDVDFLLSSRNAVSSKINTKDERLPTDTQADTSRFSTALPRKLGGPQGVMLQLWSKLFEAKCEDLGLKANEKQLHRFLKGVERQKRKLILSEMGFGQKSAVVLSQLIRVGSSIADWTHIDLSLNKLGTNLAPVVASLKMNTQLVSLRLSNNDLGGNQHIQIIKGLVKEHTSLVALDVSNDESNTCKNKLGNAGFEAIMEGIIESQDSVLSMLNIAQNNITSGSSDTFKLLRALLLMKSDRLICLNLSDNELGADFFSNLGHEALTDLQDLSLSNTRLTNKSLVDLSEFYNHHRFSLVNLNMSSNFFTAEAFFKFVNALKIDQTLRRLDLSRNDLNMVREDGIPGPFFTAMDQYLSTNKSLEELNLSDCKLGQEGAQVVGRGLRRNQRLARLFLAQNHLEDRGLQSILEGLIENVLTTSQMQGLLTPAPLVELDVSKNDIQLLAGQARTSLCKLLCEPQSKLAQLNLRDNLIRDEAAEAINHALKQNLSILKLQIDMNPIKIIILKEIELSVKRNVVRYKEKQAPLIKKEIHVLHEERFKVLMDIPHEERKGKSLLETAVTIDEKAKQYERTNTLYKQQFMEDDRRLDLIREEAGRQEKQLVHEREAVREQRRNMDFEEEQLDLRTARQERIWAKQLGEQEERLEIIRLAQAKTIDERDKVSRELGKRRDQHGLQVDAWNRELQMILREQALSQMIQESYVKEIDRVKKNQEALQAALEDCKIDIDPPGTAGSQQRFRKSQKRGSSTLRRVDSNTAVPDASTLSRRGATSIRTPLTTFGQALVQKYALNKDMALPAPPSPSQRIRELQQMKRELKQQWRRSEAESKRTGDMIVGGGGALRKAPPIQRGATIGKPHEFKLPLQKMATIKD